MDRQNQLLYLMRRIASCNYLIFSYAHRIQGIDIHEDWAWRFDHKLKRYYCFYWEKN